MPAALQEPGRDIGSGSFNIAAIAEAFAEAADMLGCALRQAAPSSAAHAEAAAWAAVQVLSSQQLCSQAVLMQLCAAFDDAVHP